MKKISVLLFALSMSLLIYQFFFSKGEDIDLEDEDQIEEVFTEKLRPKPTSTPIKKQPPRPKVKFTKKPVFQKKRPIIKPKKARYPQTNGENYALFDNEGNLVITEVARDGDHVIIQGDILIGSYEDFIQNERDRKPIRLPRAQAWPEGIIPYVISAGLPNTKNIENAIKIINEKTNVTFRPKKSSDKDYVTFNSGTNNCYSNLGRIGGKQFIILSPYCREREILHELLHTLGFIHEQNREDRDQYIDVLWHNIDDQFHSQFKKMPNHFLRVEDTPFDFSSIMLYPPNAFSLSKDEYSMTKIDGEIYPINTGNLSYWDIKRINEVYPDTAKE